MTEGEKTKFTSVDQYIEAAQYDVEPRLVEMRRIIRAAAPDAEETISYNIPAYQADGLIVVQFSGFTEHISLNFYPTAGAFTRFSAELEPYATSKSAIRFPLDEPLPVDLIDAIVHFRSEEAAEYAVRRNTGRKTS